MQPEGWKKRPLTRRRYSSNHLGERNEFEVRSTLTSRAEVWMLRSLIFLRALFFFFFVFIDIGSLAPFWFLGIIWVREPQTQMARRSRDRARPQVAIARRHFAVQLFRQLLLLEPVVSAWSVWSSVIWLLSLMAGMLSWGIYSTVHTTFSGRKNGCIQPAAAWFQRRLFFFFFFVSIASQESNCECDVAQTEAKGWSSGRVMSSLQPGQSLSVPVFFQLYVYAGTSTWTCIAKQWHCMGARFES